MDRHQGSAEPAQTAEQGGALVRGWSRREVLRAAGAFIALPFLPSLFPRAAWADGAPPAAPVPPLRLIFASTPLGFVPNPYLLKTAGSYPSLAPQGWFPEEAGPAYTLPKVHAALAPFQTRVSFIKGLTNLKYRGEVHYGDDTLLTCADTFADPSKSFSNTISCDQVAAGYEPMGGPQVRFRSLTLGMGPVFGCRNGGLSWGIGGVPISPYVFPSAAFDRLFGKDDVPASERLERLQDKRSVLDATLTQIKHLNQKLDAADIRKLDEVVSAVRDVEILIQREEAWLSVPKPTVHMARPGTDAERAQSRAHPKAMFALIHAAFLTDSTRVVTYELPDIYLDMGFHTTKHGLNHGGSDTQGWALENDAEHSRQLTSFMKLLDGSAEADGTTLLDHTIGTFGSGVWGQNHSTRELPTLIYGGGGGRLVQGQVISCPPKTPMANLWLSILKTTGMQIDRFVDSSGTIPGLTRAS